MLETLLCYLDREGKWEQDQFVEVRTGGGGSTTGEWKQYGRGAVAGSVCRGEDREVGIVQGDGQGEKVFSLLLQPICWRQRNEL